MMRLWALAWRNLWRDARAGELRLPMVAVALGVAALMSRKQLMFLILDS